MRSKIFHVMDRDLFVVFIRNIISLLRMQRRLVVMELAGHNEVVRRKQRY